MCADTHLGEPTGILATGKYTTPSETSISRYEGGKAVMNGRGGTRWTGSRSWAEARQGWLRSRPDEPDGVL